MKQQVPLPRDSEIVFRDLEHAFNQLAPVSANPVTLRRAFREFVTLTQQLTEVFRTEYSQLTGRKWVAGDFPRWTPVTSLFKKLRRSDYHEHPFLLDVRHQQTIPFGKTSAGTELAFQIHSTTEIHSAFQEDRPKSSLGIRLPKQNIWLQAIQEQSRCIVRGRTKEVRSALLTAGTCDVLELAASCMATMREYYAYYCDRLGEHHPAQVPPDST
ncbi:MAG: hypothetical protein ACJ76Y_04065 [Thermoanaerobaculia bacterium]